MIVCPFCQTQHVDNTLFCTECGTYLYEEKKRDTFPLAEDTSAAEARLSQKVDSIHTHSSTFFTVSRIPTVQLTIGEKKRKITVPLKKTLYLGRLDPTANIYPEIDLTEVNGFEMGISRQHARIIYRDGIICVEDLGSINGTTLNGRRLVAYSPERLADGDILRLGRLYIIVGLEK